MFTVMGRGGSLSQYVLSVCAVQNVNPSFCNNRHGCRPLKSCNQVDFLREMLVCLGQSKASALVASCSSREAHDAEKPCRCWTRKSQPPRHAWKLSKTRFLSLSFFCAALVCPAHECGHVLQNFTNSATYGAQEPTARAHGAAAQHCRGLQIVARLFWLLCELTVETEPAACWVMATLAASFECDPDAHDTTGSTS